jgi:hypothetical protein
VKKEKEFQFCITGLGCTGGNTFEMKMCGTVEREEDYKKRH